jgi:hypothetical protein
MIVVVTNLARPTSTFAGPGARGLTVAYRHISKYFKIINQVNKLLKFIF